MRRLRAACALLLLHSTGCGLFGKGREPTPAPIDLVVGAGRRLNPDDATGGSLSTRVRVYQLRRAGKLTSAGYEQLYFAPKEVLGEDLLQVDEIALEPGSLERRRIERDRGARALAVVAVLRHPTGTSWRDVVDLPPPEEQGRFAFVVEGYRVERRLAEERR